MAVPSRKLIIDNIKTTLEAVSTASGFKSTVNTVEVLAKTWLQTSEGVRPWLGIVPQQTDYQHLPGDLVRSKLRIDIIGHVANGTYEQKRERLANLLDDMFAALNADTTRDNNAVSTTIVQSETDEGAPDSEGTIVVSIDVVYMRTTGST